MGDNYQFLPSSPLAHESRHEVKSKDQLVRGRLYYPTPNPSSTTGRSSSPVTELKAYEANIRPKKTVSFVQEQSSFSNADNKMDENESKEINTVAINRDFNILNPDEKVLRVPLLRGKDKLFVGRSSRSCDFFLPASDRKISRVHILVDYAEADAIQLRCIGYNGFGLRIPRVCSVYASNEPNAYVLKESSDPVFTLNDFKNAGLQTTPRTIKLEDGHTEFMVNRHECVTLPRVSNILIDIRGHLVLLNPLDENEELTDEEDITLTKTNGIGSYQKNDTPIRLIGSDIPETPHKSEYKVTSEEPTPTKPLHMINPEQRRGFTIYNDTKATVENDDKTDTKQDNVITMHEYSADKENESMAAPIPSTFTRSSTPLDDKSNTYANFDMPGRRAKSEEPQKSNRKRRKAAKQNFVIDQNCIKDIPNIPEINHILVNHLAFSRLSSTPVSNLNGISAVTSKLRLDQIRVVLHNLKSVGVIYREGTDAAGEPLEEEYYYMPENDDDPKRPSLVAHIKGHGGLRSCRRTHKQYYWKKPAPIKR